MEEVGMASVRWRFGGLFWRLTASYFVATAAAAVVGTFAGRFEGPFGLFRGTTMVDFFARLLPNEVNSGLLVVALATIVGMATGLLVSRNLTARLRRIASAADGWSRGDFTQAIRDASPDELGQLARDLNHMAEQVRMLLDTRAELAVVDERNRLARDLHDSVKQHVFAGALLVRAGRTLLRQDPGRASQHLADAEALADQTQQELITLIAALRPAALADRGLVTVLRNEVDAWSRRNGVPVQVRVRAERATPYDSEDALVRVAQEALANIARHSHAHAVEIELAWDDASVSLSVCDDGDGFDPAVVSGRGIGLASMRERVAALDGTLTIASAPGATCVTARLPLPVAEALAPAEVTHD
jgi:NarL family two-component system sensor histidine kinase LiaS